MKLATKRMAMLLKKANIAATEHVYFTGDDLFAYNGNTAVIQVCETGFECLAPIKPLQKLINSISDEFVDITLEKTYLSVKSKGMKAKVQLPNDENKNGLELENSMLVEATKHFNLDGQAAILPTDFVEGVKLCLDIIKPVKKTAPAQFKSLFAKDNNVLLLTNLQVAKYIFDEPLPFEFVISRESAESINIIQPFEYYTDDNFVYFFNDNKDVLCILKKNHKYPEISDLFESDKPNHMINRDELSKLSKVTLSLKTAEQNFVNVSLSNKKIKLASSTSQGQIDQEYEGDEFTGAKGEFIINTDFLLKGIEHCDSFSIKNDVAISFQSDKLKYSVAQAINR